MINRATKLLQPKETVARRRSIRRSQSSLTDSESKTWRVTERGFSLDDTDLSGELIIDRDVVGLRQVASKHFGGRVLDPSPVLLGVRSASVSNRGTFTIGMVESSRQCRVRGRLVDVEMQATSSCPVRVHIYWKAMPQAQLDMEVLASSVLGLDSLEIQTVSSFPVGEVLMRACGTGSGWLDINDARPLGSTWLVFPRDRMGGIMSLDGRSPASEETTLVRFYRQPMVLYRPAGRRWSYVEMSRPDDCVRIMARLERRGAIVSFGLFGLDIEKGVILRGRVRGRFIPRANDLRTSLRLFSGFQNESPRLSV